MTSVASWLWRPAAPRPWLGPRSRPSTKGPFLIYGGQEAGADHTPTLFDTDKVEWGDYALQPYLTRLARLKKDPAQRHGQFVLLGGKPAIRAAWMRPEGGLYGVFNVSAVEGNLPVHLPDGVYTDLLSDDVIRVQGGDMAIPTSACILRCEGDLDLRPFYAPLLDYHLAAA